MLKFEAFVGMIGDSVVNYFYPSTSTPENDVKLETKV